jgi:hypothetical protein
MNNQAEHKEDPFRRYVTSERIEKAPEGFTSKVMTRVRLETLPLITTERSGKKNLVPVISFVVTLLLIASAFLIPDNQSDSLVNPVLDLFKTLNILKPEMDLSSIFRITLPSVMIYVFIGILILTLFDRTLFRIFHREK